MDFQFMYILMWVCILGLCLGSFYNVVILRSLTGESIVLPPSKCPKCGNKLKPWHNIPVLSFLLLKGKCAYCKEKISIQYPIVEILTMILFATSYIKFGFEWKTLFSIIILSSLLVMTMTDIKEKLVDCNIAISLAIVGLIYNAIINNSLLDSFYGLIAGILIMEILARIGYIVKKERAFGEADTYVAGALGACVGFKTLPLLLINTLIAAAIIIIPIYLIKLYKNNQKLTLITFILFILAAIFIKTIDNNWFIFSLLVLLGIILIINTLKSLRNNPEPMYLPFLPAFSIATLFFLFF